MAKHTKRLIRDTYRAILEDKASTPEVRIKAADHLWRIESQRVKCKPRGKPFPKKNSGGGNEPNDRIARLVLQ